MQSRELFREKHGSSGLANAYVITDGSGGTLNVLEGNLRSRNIIKFLQEIFLPYGFPESVSEDYIAYQLWDTVQAFCSTVSGILTTQAILQGVGVGNNLASPLAATITWILKDGVGMAGKIAFAWWKGTSLDSDFKKWRFFADLLNDCALTLELLLFYYTELSTVILCISSSMKAIVGVAGGATRAAITQHQAVRGNMADVSAKDGSQETCVNLIASFVGIFILTYIDTSRFMVPLFLVLTTIHIFANYRAVRSIVMKTLNGARYRELLQSYLSTDEVGEPQQISHKEPVLLGCGMNDVELCHHHIIIGTTIQKVLKSKKLDEFELQKIIELFMRKKYIITYDDDQRVIYIIIHKEADSVDVLKSYFHAVILGVTVHSCTSSDKTTYTSSLLRYLQNEGSERFLSPKSMIPLLRMTNAVVANEFDKFKKIAEIKGWIFTDHDLLLGEWRAEW